MSWTFLYWLRSRLLQSRRRSFSTCIFVLHAVNNADRNIMNTQVLSYLIFGLALVILFIVIIAHYYSRERHRKGEEAKYRMLDDDE